MVRREDIKKLLIDCGVTAAELAKRLDMTPQNFNTMLNKKEYRQGDLQKIANALGVEYISEFRQVTNNEGNKK